MRAYELEEDFNTRTPIISLRDVNRLKHERLKREAERRARQPIINAMYGRSSTVEKAEKPKKKKIDLVHGSDGLSSAKPPSVKKTPKRVAPTPPPQVRQKPAINPTSDAAVPAPTSGSNGADENHPEDKL